MLLIRGFGEVHSEIQDAVEKIRRNDDLRDRLAAVSPAFSPMEDAISATLRRHELEREMLGAQRPWEGLGSSGIERLKRKLQEGFEAASRQAALAAVLPSYDKLADIASYAKPAWSELLTSSTASYAFTAMAALREAIERAPFADETLAALHSQLGDFSSLGLSDELLEQQSRQEAYLRAGMDHRLIDLGSETFDAMATATELRPADLPPPQPRYVSADLAKAAVVEEDEELEQAGEDYKLLYQFESQLRAFIDEVMTEAVGPDWIKQRVPGDCLKEWRQRQGDDRAAQRQIHPLLSYADLGDWSKIIRRKDNWPLFQTSFNRLTFVEESFNRLIPLRNDVAHMRPLTGADRLVFYSEIHQLWAAIQRSAPGLAALPSPAPFRSTI